MHVFLKVGLGRQKGSTKYKLDEPAWNRPRGITIYASKRFTKQIPTASGPVFVPIVTPIVKSG